jgi:hypothetical protein
MELVKELEVGWNKNIPLKVYFDFRGESIEKYWVGNISVELPDARPVEAHMEYIFTYCSWYVRGYFPIEVLLKLPAIPREVRKKLEAKRKQGCELEKVAFPISEKEAEEIRETVEKKTLCSGQLWLWDFNKRRKGGERWNTTTKN